MFWQLKFGFNIIRFLVQFIFFMENKVSVFRWRNSLDTKKLIITDLIFSKKLLKREILVIFYNLNTCCPFSYALQPKTFYASVAVPPALVGGSYPMATYIECHISHFCRAMRGWWGKTWDCAQISWYLPYGWGKSWKISAKRPSDECATSKLLKWSALPPNQVGRISQWVRERGGKNKCTR